jgi:hypothetical protein
MYLVFDADSGVLSHSFGSGQQSFGGEKDPTKLEASLHKHEICSIGLARSGRSIANAYVNRAFPPTRESTAA